MVDGDVKQVATQKTLQDAAEDDALLEIILLVDFGYHHRIAFPGENQGKNAAEDLQFCRNKQRDQRCGSQQNSTGRTVD
jgi:hypothetical protein